MAGCEGASLPGGAAAAAWKMAASCGSELPANSPLKIPKMEVLSPASPGDLSDGNPSLSDPSTPRGASPLGPGSAAGSGTAASGGPGLGGRSAASSSASFSPGGGGGGGGGGGAAAAAAAACRGMSWTPAETNALIAVWGNERLVEARYQQLEGAGTVFGSKAPGPAMYERVSRALAELGYDRTPSQCRERIKVTGRPARGSEPEAKKAGKRAWGRGPGLARGSPPGPRVPLASPPPLSSLAGKGRFFPDGRQPVGFLSLKLGVSAAAPLSCQLRMFLRSEVASFFLCAGPHCRRSCRPYCFVPR